MNSNDFRSLVSSSLWLQLSTKQKEALTTSDDDNEDIDEIDNDENDNSDEKNTRNSISNVIIINQIKSRLLLGFALHYCIYGSF